jgi:HK97 gp10 family phage protein
MITMRWNQAVVNNLERAIVRGVRRATHLVESRARLLCHKAAKPVRKRRKRDTGRGALYKALSVVEKLVGRFSKKAARRVAKFRARKAASGGPKGSTYTIWIGSKPGEPPMMRTRLGVRSIASEFEDGGLTGKVGVKRNAVYMLYLETGTRTIQPRPWLLRAFEETKDTAAALIQAEIAGAVS